MRLNHLDFHVPDITATADFFIRHFGLMLKDMRGQNGLAILTDDAGLEIVLSHAIAKFGTSDQVELQRQTYHIGFILADRAHVDAVHAGLVASGADLSGPPATMRGVW